MEITKIEGFDSQLNYESRYEQPIDIVADGSMLRNPNLESHLLITHAKIINDFEKEIEDFPEYACCSCEVWPRLTSFIMQ